MVAQNRALDREAILELALLVVGQDRMHGTEYAELTLTNNRPVRVNKRTVTRLEELSNGRTKIFMLDGKNVTVKENIDTVTVSTLSTPRTTTLSEAVVASTASDIAIRWSW